MSRVSNITTWIGRHHLALTLLLALLLRLLLWSQPLHQPANDEVEYITVARDLLAGRGWQFYDHFYWLRAPLYPLFLAASLWLAGGDLHRAALPNIALSVANVYLSYCLTRALAGKRAAGVAALFTAMLWTLATFASLYMSETLFAFLFTAALVCLVRPPLRRRGSRAARGAMQAPAPSIAFRAGEGLGRRLPRTVQDRLVSLSSCHLVGVAAAGALFGLATLTRSITLLFLPVVALWLLQRQKAKGERQKLWHVMLPAFFFTFAFCLLILPWTIRNYMAYNRVILVETGLSYNIWFFNEPHEDRNTIYRSLKQITNPAERSDYAMSRGMARLREDPTIPLRKLWPNLVYLWRIKPIEDRFLMESYYADVGLPLFSSALIFDDILYLLIALAAVAGLVFRRPTLRYSSTQAAEPSPPPLLRRLPSWPRGRTGGRQPTRFRDPQSLLSAWLFYVVVTVLLTHGEARYRHLLFPVLIAYAAWALIRGAQEMRSERNLEIVPYPGFLVVAVLWAIILGVLLGSYPWAWAGQNLARGWHTLVGDLAGAVGERTAALQAYERATDAQETPDGWLRRGDAARALGDLPRALHAYRQATRLTPPYVAASARLGDLLRELGDNSEARKAFEGSYADDQEVIDWAWNNLLPAPKPALDIGNELDYGYVGGVYPAEKLQGATARWTNGHGRLRLGGMPNGRAEQGAALLRLRLAAPRPDGVPARAQVCAEGNCWTLSVGAAWRIYTLPFSVAPNEPLTVEVRSDTFDAPDGRRLGMLIDTASVQALWAPIAR
jgi:4-amino-4-deoxy-L-arabinose transferase-like glycosyltransferase